MLTPRRAVDQSKLAAPGKWEPHLHFAYHGCWLALMHRLECTRFLRSCWPGV